jgi:hypothetical protein
MIRARYVSPSEQRARAAESQPSASAAGTMQEQCVRFRSHRLKTKPH